MMGLRRAEAVPSQQKLLEAPVLLLDSDLLPRLERRRLRLHGCCCCCRETCMHACMQGAELSNVIQHGRNFQPPTRFSRFEATFYF